MAPARGNKADKAQKIDNPPPWPLPAKTNGTPATNGQEAPASPRSINTFNHDQPDPKVVAQAVQDMMKNVMELRDAFDSFQGRTTGISHLPPPVDIATQVRELRRDLVKKDADQEQEINEISYSLRHTFTNHVVERLRMQLERMVREEVAKRIKERVAAELERQFPTELADKLRLHQKQLKSVKLALHNSEARRANAAIRATHLDEPLTPLWTVEGAPSDVFPHSLATFFTMPESTCQKLLNDYGLPSSEGEPREKVLNRIMAYIGVTFQMVPGPGAATLSIA